MRLFILFYFTNGLFIYCRESATKTPKPYIEGPHCPNFMKIYNKDTHNVHKCAENNVLCIRHGNLKQHLLHLYEKSVPICIEVSLGPDCLCGELRSQSTLVSATPSKRDIVLEQWTVTVIHKRWGFLKFFVPVLKWKYFMKFFPKLFFLWAWNIND